MVIVGTQQNTQYNIGHIYKLGRHRKNEIYLKGQCDENLLYFKSYP